MVKSVAGAEGSGSKETVEAWGTFRGNEWDNRGEVVGVKTQGQKSVLEVRVLREKGYYLERTGCKSSSMKGVYVESYTNNNQSHHCPF